MDLAFALTAFVTLFVIIDPIGIAPLFLALTRGMSPVQRRAVALRAAVIATALLALFGFVGESLLSGIGISMPAFQIAGGILLFLTALDMLFDRRSQRRSGHAAEVPDPSVFPLAMPLIAGPGAMTTMILLVDQAGRNAQDVAMVMGVMIGVVLSAFVMCLAGARIEALLGRTGMMVVTRLLGMLLAALSVQFVLNGLREAGVIATL